MSANFSDPAPGAGTDEPQKPAEAQPGLPTANGNVQFDPQQSFREYTSSGVWSTPAAMPSPVTPRPGYPAATPPPATSSPIYPSAGAYQPVYPGQGGGAWQPGAPLPALPYPSYVPSPPYPVPNYPTYPGYGSPPGYGAYPGYGMYPGYGYYSWPQTPMQPRRDTYLLATSIAAFVCSCLVILGGLICLAFTVLASIGQSVSRTQLSGGTFFAGIMLFLALALVGIVGGGFSFYHSLCSLFLRRPSRNIWLPRFWIFLLCYLATLGMGFWMHTRGLDVTSLPLTGLLIYLGGIFPALAIMALGIRRLSFPKTVFRGRRLPGPVQTPSWPTSWRRLTLALVSGATLSIVLASILELIFQFVLLGNRGNGIFQYFSNPEAGNPSPSLYGVLMIMLAVVAPFVEEIVKPLAVVILLGRVRSKTEAFVLGLACGIGFNLVETTGYISQGYGSWLSVALSRSGAGLLHGFGAAMMALGWYILTHREEGIWRRRAWLALGCAGYAILQHAIWNGSIGLVFLSGPIGTFFQTWSWNAGPFTIDGIELVNVVEAIAILVFFIYITGRLRIRRAAPPTQERGAQPAEGTYLASGQAGS